MTSGVLVALASLALSLQQPSQGRAAFILGRVVDAITGRPVDGATVTLSLSGNRTSVAKPLVPATGLTDDQGRFLFRNLSKGRYSVSVTAAGYLEAAYGQRQPGGPSRLIALEDDQTLGGVDIRIWKAASIAGTITDDQDRVVVGLYVSLLRADVRSGRVRLSESEFGGRYSVQTNDRGDFDFSRLGPGDYVVVVPEHMATAPSSLVPVRNSGSGYTTTFHPGASRPEDAAIVSLVPGDRRAGIDLRLRRSSTYTVSGTLVGPEGPLAKSQVYLIPTYATGTPLEKTHFAAMAITDSRGGFKFSSVATGQYVARAWKRLPRTTLDAQPASVALWGEAEVRVEDTGATDVELSLRPGATVSGRFEFHGSAATPRMSLLQTSVGQAFEPTWPLAFGTRPAAVVESDGTFLTEALPPGRYFLRLPNQFSVPGWFFESATLEGRNLAVHPLELNGAPVTDVVITLTDRHTELSGSVRDTRGELDPSATVIVFPAEYQEWMRNQMNPLAARVVAVSQSATYFIDDLPAGAYLVAAMSDEQASLWRQPATIQSLAAGAARINLLRGGNTVQDLRTRR